MSLKLTYPTSDNSDAAPGECQLARLIITGKSQAASIFVLAAGESSIGRGPMNEVVLDGNGVSRRHAVLRWDGHSFEITDLGSKNGTLVNGERIEGARPLAPGDVITIPDWSLRLDAEEETVTRSATTPGRASVGGQAVVLKPETREVIVRGQPVLLAPKEYLALTLLYEHAGTVVAKDALAAKVWPEYGGEVSDYNIHQVISRLRRELEADPAHPRILITRPGFGYMLLR